MDDEGGPLEKRSILRDYGATVVTAVTIALMIRFFVIEAYRIPNSAMRPTLEPGDTLFVAKWPFGLRFGGSKPFTQGRLPHPGEVVVYEHPSNPPRDSIKRVIGIPGDTVQIIAGRLFLNGKPVSEVARKDAPCGSEVLPGRRYPVCWEPPLLETIAPQIVPPGSVLVLGDARTQPTIPLPGETVVQPVYAIVPFSALKGSALWIWLSIQPSLASHGSSLFSRIRFERMFRRIQ